MKVDIQTNDDWEVIYIDGKIHEQGHILGQGNSRLYLLELSEKLGFSSKDISEEYIAEDTELGEKVMDYGCFPDMLNDLTYSKEEVNEKA